jgi:hypothetical protein
VVDDPRKQALSPKKLENDPTSQHDSEKLIGREK